MARRGGQNSNVACMKKEKLVLEILHIIILNTHDYIKKLVLEILKLLHMIILNTHDYIKKANCMGIRVYSGLVTEYTRTSVVRV